MRRAVSFLTPFGGPADPAPSALAWFPAVGALIGLAVGGIWWAARRGWAPPAAAAIAVIADAALTGMLHLDGLADAADGLLPPLSRARRLEVMADPRLGAFGAAGLAIVLLARFGAFASMLPSPLAVAGLWSGSRTAMAVTARAVPYARPAGLASAFLPAPAADGTRPGAAARLAGPAVLGLAGGLLALALAFAGRGALGVAAVGAEAVGAAAVVFLAWRRLGGFTGDVLGAAAVVGETVGLLALACDDGADVACRGGARAAARPRFRRTARLAAPGRLVRPGDDVRRTRRLPGLTRGRGPARHPRGTARRGGGCLPGFGRAGHRAGGRRPLPGRVGPHRRSGAGPRRPGSGPGRAARAGGPRPAGMDENEMARAVVESVAENTVDAVVAPAFWAAVGGAPGALGYRAVNTMDAMVGHRSPRYQAYGWASARLDDAAGYLPARLTAALVAGVRPGRAADIWRAVRSQAPAHPSPNAGVAEAAFAAALGLRLGGCNRYGERVEHRPWLGQGRPATRSDIQPAVRLSDDVNWLLTTVLAAAGLAAHRAPHGTR